MKVKDERGGTWKEGGRRSSDVYLEVPKVGVDYGLLIVDIQI
jgi:hypothetical protein